MRKLISLFIVLTLGIGAWAQETQSVKYIDADGQEQMAYNVTEITNTSSTLNAGWYVVLGSDVHTGTLTCNGAIHLILADGAKLKATGSAGTDGTPGIKVSSNGSSLSIYGQTTQNGQLFANGGEWAAGIGGGYNGSGSNVTINGGIVTANGGYQGAGIGGGAFQNGFNITINGGKVTANGDCAAGIGGGYKGSGSNIIINDGNITVSGGSGGAGIGGGQQGSSSNITINGGTVTAYGGTNGAGIGGGYKGSGSNITIKGGTIKADGGEKASGIGNGENGSRSSVYVADDCVVKTGEHIDPTEDILHSSIEENIAEKLSGKRYTTSKQIPLEELKTYINSLIKDKANSAKNEIEKTSLADADKEKEKEKINNYVATAATTINSAINANVVINAQNTAISAIDKVLSEVKLADAKIVAMAKVKNEADEAKNTIDTTSITDSEKTTSKARIDNIVATAQAKIELAATETEATNAWKEADLAIEKVLAIVAIYEAMQGETESEYLHGLIENYMSAINNATIISTINTNKNDAISTLNSVMQTYKGAYSEGRASADSAIVQAKAEGFAEGQAAAFGTMGEPCTSCTAIKVTKDEEEVILYAPDKVEYIIRK